MTAPSTTYSTNLVQLYTYQELWQSYHIDRGGNSACLRLQHASLQQEQWQAERRSRCKVSRQQVKVPLSEWGIITIMWSTNIPYYAGWLLHNGSSLHEWMPAGLLLLSFTGWVANCAHKLLYSVFADNAHFETTIKVVMTNLHTKCQQ